MLPSSPPGLSSESSLPRQRRAGEPEPAELLFLAHQAVVQAAALIRAAAACLPAGGRAEAHVRAVGAEVAEVAEAVLAVTELRVPVPVAPEALARFESRRCHRCGAGLTLRSAVRVCRGCSSIPELCSCPEVDRG